MGRNELLPHSEGKIITPEQFNQRFLTDSAYQAAVAGWATYSLPHVVHSLSTGNGVLAYNSNFEPRHKTYINIEALPQILKKVFPHETYSNVRDRFDTKEHTLAWIKGNGRIFGKVWGLHDYIHSLGVDYSLIDSRDGYLNLYLSEIFHKEYSEYTDAEMKQLLQNEIQRGRWENPIHIIEQLGSIDIFVDAIRESVNHKGVQLIYGDQAKLRNFIQEQKCRPVDDVGVQLFTPTIPAELILQIIPLGSYEQQQLLGR